MKDRSKRYLLIAGLVLASLGQFYFAYRRAYVWDGVAFWAGGVLLVGLALWRWGGARALSASPGVGRPWWLTALRERPIHAAVATLGVGLSLLAGLWARGRPPYEGFADVLVIWFGGVVAFLGAFVAIRANVPRRHWGRDLARPERTRLRKDGLRLVGALLILLVGLTVRAYDLEHIPANLGGDEGTQGAEALELVEAPMGNPFATGWFSVPTMSFLAYGLSMEVFGPTVAGLRMLSALLGTATLGTTFLLARELWGERVAWLSTPALAFGHYHLHFSRLGSNQIADALFVTLALWLLVRGLRTKEVWAFAATGVAVGLGWYGYFGARLVGIVVATYLGLRALLDHRFLVRHRVPLLVMGAGVLVAAAPLLLHYASRPAEAASRLNQVSIFASGWLAREQEITGRSSISLLLQQGWKSISAFNYTLDPTFWYHPSIPLLDLVGGLFFVVGVVWALVHYRWPSNSLLLLWFWLAILLGWVLTENPPSSQRMVIVSPAVALMVGLGLDQVISLVAARCAAWEGGQWAAAAALLLLMAGINLGYYFLVYTPTRVYGNPTAEMTTVLARRLASDRCDGPILFHGPPAVFWGFGTLRFMARDVRGVDVPPPGEGGIPKLDATDGACFIFHPTRANELAEVKSRFPRGTETRVQSGATKDLLYVQYAINP